MFRRSVLLLLPGMATLGLSACQPMGVGSTTSSANATEKVSQPVEIGSPLYKKVEPETVNAVGIIEEHVVVPGAVVRLDKKQSVPSEVDGKIEVIGTIVGQGPIPAGNPQGLMHNAADQMPIDKRPLYRRLREGDVVQKGSVIAALNDTDVMVQMESATKLKDASAEAIKMAKQGTVAVDKLKVQMVDLVSKKVGAMTELLNIEAQLARYLENEFTSEKDRVRAEGDEKRAQTLRVKHYPVSMVNGIITKIVRQPDEFVKAGDTIMEIVSTDEVGVEGNLEASYADKVLPGMKVTVEPNMSIGPDNRFGGMYHQLEVTCVAVVPSKDRPLIVSGSLDGNAVVWDVFPPAGQSPKQTRLAHTVAVRALAQTISPKAVIATGCDDGKIRLWDLSNPDKISDKPTKELEETHGTALSSLSFSPDGKYLASAAGREVWIWEVATGKKMYALPAEHRDAVTSIRYTPQATLLTLARDKALRVWKLGDKAAALERTVDHRKGNVDVLGLSSGGGRVLFDQDDGRIDVISMATGLPVGRIVNPATAARFSNLAIFSPDDQFVLTAGTEGELQLWDAPQAGGRAAERRRLVTRDRATPTAAAFSTDPERRFMVVGTQAGGVHVWTEATLTAKSKVRTGRVTSTLRVDAKTVKVRVETDPIPGATPSVSDVLQDKGTATIIIRSADSPAKTALAPVPGEIVPAGFTVPTGKPGEVVVPAGPAIPSVTVGEK